METPAKPTDELQPGDPSRDPSDPSNATGSDPTSETDVDPPLLDPETPPNTDANNCVGEECGDATPTGGERVPVADPGDARPDHDRGGEHLLSTTKAVGPKKLQASAAAYGMVVTNVVYITGTVGPTGESPVFAVAGSRQGDGLASDGQFLITSRQSRFGFKGDLQITQKVDVGALIELDFFGLHENEGPTSVIQPAVRLRLAKLDIGTERFRFIAGQDWSVITPRLPTSLSHMVVAAHTFSGAVWGRLPQVTFVFRQPVGKQDGALGKPAFKLQVSATRTFSGDGFGGGITRFDLADPGTLSRLPQAQLRMSFESEMLTIGAAGHLGRDSFPVARLDADGALTTIDDHVPTWMGTADLKVAGKWVWIAGQGYIGYNANNMLSGQGVRYDTWTEDDVDIDDPRLGEDRDVVGLPAGGGWLEFGAYLGTPKVRLVASGGADVGWQNRVAVGSRWLNMGVLAGLIYAPVPMFDMSLEYQRIQSYYRTPEEPDGSASLGTNDFVATTFRLKF